GRLKNFRRPFLMFGEIDTDYSHQYFYSGLTLNQYCNPPPPFALCYINFCTRYVLKVAAAFALYIG
ncbi:hypothetical protein, partial [Neisseria sp. HMSC064E01]|uniref:hypothetical protein n=1 Tax=Neisseria sp. HMSC064E01 TaxID=1715052 RepID=UPI001AEF4C23